MRISLATLVGLLLLGVGCAGVYTGIKRADDGSYTVTKITQGFWRVYGTVYRCTETGTTLTCAKIDTPSR
jgi:hypothetical protein